MSNRNSTIIATGFALAVGALAMYLVFDYAFQPIELPPLQKLPETFSPTFSSRHHRPGEHIQFTLIFNDIFQQLDSLKARVAELEENYNAR
jgi:hypothetical protein